MITTFQRYATWRNTIILFAAQIAFQLTILYLIYPRIGGPGVPLDMRSGMSVPEVQDYLAGIGEKGRRIYALNEGTFDLVFPFLYSSAYAFLFVRLITPLAGAASRWQFLALLPFGVAIADLFENASIIGAVATYERPGIWFDGVLLFNTIKGSLMMIAIPALFILLCGRLLLFLFRKR
jgi:hypothetical protein